MYDAATSASPIVKAAWAGGVIVAMGGMTRGLWATVYIEPTSEAITAERHGYLLVAYPSAAAGLVGGLFLSR